MIAVAKNLFGFIFLPCIKYGGFCFEDNIYSSCTIQYGN